MFVVRNENYLILNKIKFKIEYNLEINKIKIVQFVIILINIFNLIKEFYNRTL